MRIIELFNKPEMGVKFIVKNKVFEHKQDVENKHNVPKRILSSFVPTINKIAQIEVGFARDLNESQQSESLASQKQNENIAQQFLVLSSNKSKEFLINNKKSIRISSAQISQTKSVKINGEEVLSSMMIRNAFGNQSYQNPDIKFESFKQTKSEASSNFRKKNEISKIKNRIVPYSNFSENCKNVLKKIKFSSKSQKDIFAFNKEIIKNAELNNNQPKIVKTEYNPIVPSRKREQFKRGQSSKVI